MPVELKVKQLWLGNNLGQSGLIDALLFVAILTIASTIIHFSSISSIHEVVNRDYTIQYTKDTQEALLKCTIDYCWYYDSDGNKITLEDLSVQELILEDLYLRNNSKYVNLTSLEIGLESKINTLIYNLTEPNYHYMLQAKYEAKDAGTGTSSRIIIQLGDSQSLPAERFASSVYVNVPNQQQNGSKTAEITLYIWHN